MIDTLALFQGIGETRSRRNGDFTLTIIIVVEYLVNVQLYPFRESCHRLSVSRLR